MLHLNNFRYSSALLRFGPVPAHLRLMAASQLQAFALVALGIRHPWLRPQAACFHAGRPATTFASSAIATVLSQWHLSETQQD